MRARRGALAPAMRHWADARICAHLAHSYWLRPSRIIALYVSMGDEADTASLRALCQERGCAVYLPRITDFSARRMRFCLDSLGKLRVNRMGIAEPALRESVPAHWLSLILLPILGFDSRGTRLGYGGGFYDRALAFRLTQPAPPLLIGVAYACQELAHIARAAHDVALDGVATENSIRGFGRRGVI
jgi:5-formyltetrahydrofolate cyclo-ligase